MKTQSITSPRVYLIIFAALLVLTVITVAASRVDLGVWHIPVALSIAVCKATLVGLFFMHLLDSDKLTWVVVVGSLLWLVILFVLTLSDYLSRVPIRISGS